MSDSPDKVRKPIDTLLSKAIAEGKTDLLREVEGNRSFGFLKVIFLFSALMRDMLNEDEPVAKKPKIK
jgi:hypothetical protein